jgi:uncharacterized damage-inducible protein DinB
VKRGIVVEQVQFPIGKLEAPVDATLEDVKGWLAQTETYTKRLRETLEGISEEDYLKTYREGAWNVRQLVHHIADSQLNMYQRLKLALTDDFPTVPAFDENKWAVQPDTTLPAAVSINMLEAINERVVALGKTLTLDQLERGFIHEVNGKVTVATKVKKLAWHEEHHLAHIKIALGKWN